ncbi:MAG: phosphatidate cytidylyltransferase [Cyanobacteriota bacterium]
MFTATIFIAILVAACIAGGWFWTLFLGILIFVGADEYIKLLNAKDINPSRVLIFLFSLIFLLLAHFNLPQYFIHVIIFAFILTFIWFLFTGKLPSSSDIFSTVFGILYAGLMPVGFSLIRHIDKGAAHIGILEPGAGFLLLTLLCICAVDIGAYYIGRKFGKNLLSPKISPKKTVEGSIGGAISGILLAVIIGTFINISIVHSIILGIIIVAIAQLGDLCESLLKRDVGVKDSGDCVPGHGGVLDRADSYIMTASASYYYINYVIVSGLF